MAGVGRVHNQEGGQIERVEQIAPVLQAEIEHQIVGEQGEDQTVDETVAVGFQHLPVLRLSGVGQMDGQHHRIRRLDAHEHSGGAGREIVRDREIAIVDRAVRERQGVAEAVAGDLPFVAEQMDVDPVEPGGLHGQTSRRRQLSVVDDLEAQPHRRRADAETQDRRRRCRERAVGVGPARRIEIERRGGFLEVFDVHPDRAAKRLRDIQRRGGRGHADDGQCEGGQDRDKAFHQGCRFARLARDGQGLAVGAYFVRPPSVPLCGGCFMPCIVAGSPAAHHPDT